LWVDNWPYYGSGINRYLLKLGNMMAFAIRYFCWEWNVCMRSLLRLRSVQFRCNGPIRKHVRSVQQHYSNSLPFALPTIIEKSDCLYLFYEKWTEREALNFVLLLLNVFEQKKFLLLILPPLWNKQKFSMRFMGYGPVRWLTYFSSPER
jgi:hypothetical protein